MGPSGRTIAFPYPRQITTSTTIVNSAATTAAKFPSTSITRPPTFTGQGGIPFGSDSAPPNHRLPAHATKNATGDKPAIAIANPNPTSVLTHPPHNNPNSTTAANAVVTVCHTT